MNLSIFKRLSKILERRFAFSKKEIGELGENLAVKYLRKKGYRVLERNLRNKGGEIDIVAEVNDTVIFIEVKTRSPRSLATPESAIDFEKQKRIRKTAKMYLTGYFNPSPIRFDTITILLDDWYKPIKISHTEDAFPGWEIKKRAP